MNYIGDFAEDSTIRIFFSTNNASGGRVEPSSALENDDVKIYKGSSATEKTSVNGLTMTSPFDARVGIQLLVIDTSNDTGDAGFWAAGNDYTVILYPDETIDGQNVSKVLAQFSIENRYINKQVIAKALKDTNVASTNPIPGSVWADIMGPMTIEELQERNNVSSGIISKVINGKTQKYGVHYTQDGAAAGTRNFQEELLGALIGLYDQTAANPRQMVPILGFYYQDGSGNISEINGIAGLLGVNISTGLDGAGWTGAADEKTAGAGAGYTLITPFFDNLDFDYSNQDLRIIYPRVQYLPRENSKMGIPKNTALNGFMFDLVLSSNHISPSLTAVVTAQRSIDGAAFAACSNAVSEVGSGTYKINLSAADLNGDIITLKFSAAATDTRKITLKTE